MNKKKIIGLLILLIGLGVLMFPFLSMIQDDLRQIEAGKHYQETIQKNKKQLQEKRKTLEKTTTETQVVQDIFNQSRQEAEQQKSPYANLLDTDQVNGRISIPALGQNFDLYLDATYEKIEKGVATLIGTGAPLGIPGQRPIIAGHRITYNDMSFYFLPNLKPGDKIYVTFLDQTLEYEVYDSEVIGEYDSDKLKPFPNEDIITLMTCVNPPNYDQRLLVNARRVKHTKPLPPKDATLTQFLQTPSVSARTKVERLLPYLIVTLGSIAILYFLRRLVQEIYPKKKNVSIKK